MWPRNWSSATVVALFKSGATALPQNYRPISLLTVGYKVLARLILNRLRASGAEDNLRSSQFGFRAGRSTSQAIFLAKRLIERAVAAKGGRLSLVLLDWSKAFDKIQHAWMLEALRGHGLPAEYLDMIAAVYRNRAFSGRDGGCISSLHCQDTGIAQGCPLSSYLFIIVLPLIFVRTTP